MNIAQSKTIAKDTPSQLTSPEAKLSVFQTQSGLLRILLPGPCHGQTSTMSGSPMLLQPQPPVQRWVLTGPPPFMETLVMVPLSTASGSIIMICMSSGRRNGKKPLRMLNCNDATCFHDNSLTYILFTVLVQ